MPVYYIVDLANQLHLHFASDNQLAILCSAWVALPGMPITTSSEACLETLVVS